MSQAIATAQANNSTLLKSNRHIHKFGGSSLIDSNAYRRVAGIVKEHANKNDIVVVSAAGSTTNQLIRIADQLIESPNVAKEHYAELQHYQRQLIDQLLSPDNASALIVKFEADLVGFNIDFAQIDGDYFGSDRFRNDWLALGEVWSSRLLAALLTEQGQQSLAVDAREFVVVDDTHHVDFEIAIEKWAQHQHADHLHVVTGFIAKNKLDVNCTLGRNGSDYSATIMARIINADTATIWTDVDGIYNADPRQIQQARKIQRINWHQAQALSQLGNPVLHPNTLLPLSNSPCKLYVRSSIEPQKPATRICHHSHHDNALTAMTSLNRVAMLTLPKSDWEHVKSQFADLWQLASVEKRSNVIVAFHDESSSQLAERLQSISLTRATIENGALLALVGTGDYLHERFDDVVTAQLEANDIIAIDNDNPFAAVYLLKTPASQKANYKLYQTLFGQRKRVGLLVAGRGNIGHTFLTQLIAQQSRFSPNIDVSLLGVFGSQTCLFNVNGIDSKTVVTDFDKNAVAYQWQNIIADSGNWNCDELIVVDITSSTEFSDLYGTFFGAGFHVITANKHANSASLADYNDLVSVQQRNHRQWLYNTTVGAGLPINSAMTDLRDSGDKIKAISGIFSGTLSWLFEKFDGSQPFSTLLLNALDLGYTEPDPREDLSGRDVHRKLLILARLAGFEVDPDDIGLESLVPASLRDISKSEFLADLSELDKSIDEKWQQANADGLCLRYIAEFRVTEAGLHAAVGIQAVDPKHAFANLTPGDNIFVVESTWYSDNPLIIRGPGAGREVTAGGLHSDLAKLLTSISQSASENAGFGRD